MVSTDPISDMLTRIRNAILVNKNSVEVPHSKQKLTIANELKSSGFIHDVQVTENASNRKVINVIINDELTNPKITKLERVSKPGRRIYSKANKIPRVKNGRGLIIVSTSKGIMTGDEAIKQKLGGELICKVY